ncbi:hypothetical protein [Weissella minor]|uniref:hypothetical protein n=1 Tax=Weissella minor TaxID=1620 RepID=UPI003AF238B6
MDEEYADRLKRLGQLEDPQSTPTQTSEKKPKQTKKQTAKTAHNRKSQLAENNTAETHSQTHHKNTPMHVQKNIYRDKFFWILLVISTLSQLAIWWIYPFIYSKQLVGGPLQQSPLLVTYSVLLAIATYFTFAQGITVRLNYIFILIPIGFIYFLYQEMTGQQVILLALLPISLFLINIPWLNLKNILGLVLYSGLATLSLPVVIFYQQNTFLTPPFILSLVPLFLSYLYYMSSIFIPYGTEKRVTGLVFGIFLLLVVLSLPWNLWTLSAVILIIFTWMVLINFDLKLRYRMGILSFLEMITVLVIFLQQR